MINETNPQGAPSPAPAGDQMGRMECREEAGGFLIEVDGKPIFTCSRGSHALDMAPGMTLPLAKSALFALGAKLLRVDERAASPSPVQAPLTRAKREANLIDNLTRLGIEPAQDLTDGLLDQAPALAGAPSAGRPEDQDTADIASLQADVAGAKQVLANLAEFGKPIPWDGPMPPLAEEVYDAIAGLFLRFEGAGRPMTWTREAGNVPAETKYRPLLEGELIRERDQALHEDGWHGVGNHSIGHAWNPRDWLDMRRAIPSQDERSESGERSEPAPGMIDLDPESKKALSENLFDLYTPAPPTPASGDTAPEGSTPVFGADVSRDGTATVEGFRTPDGVTHITKTTYTPPIREAKADQPTINQPSSKKVTEGEAKADPAQDANQGEDSHA